MESIVHDQAWVTLATNDSYALGALVLAHSLRRVNTNRHVAVMVTTEVSQGMREHLGSVFNSVTQVNVLDSSDQAHLALMQRPDLGITFTKLHCWRLTQFSKCVFMDADTLVIQNCDDLFEREELSAAPDVGWPDCFNTGVFVFKPSEETFLTLLNFAVQHGSFDGGDQGLLNLFFHDWATKDICKHLPFIYNMTSSAAYSYLPAYKTFGKDVKVVHFLGAIKPWMHSYDANTRQVHQREGSFHGQEHLQFWWDIFIQDVQHRLQPDYAGLAGQLALLVIGLRAPVSAEDERARQLAWESGHVDYLGRDSFENIQRKLDESISSDSSPTSPKSAEEPQPAAESPKPPAEPIKAEAPKPAEEPAKVEQAQAQSAQPPKPLEQPEPAKVEQTQAQSAEPPKPLAQPTPQQQPKPAAEAAAPEAPPAAPRRSSAGGDAKAQKQAKPQKQGKSKK